LQKSPIKETQKRPIILRGLLIVATPYWITAKDSEVTPQTAIHHESSLTSKYRLFYRALLQKRPIILRSLIMWVLSHTWIASCLSQNVGCGSSTPRAIPAETTSGSGAATFHWRASCYQFEPTSYTYDMICVCQIVRNVDIYIYVHTYLSIYAVRQRFLIGIDIRIYLCIYVTAQFAPPSYMYDMIFVRQIASNIGIYIYVYTYLCIYVVWQYFVICMYTHMYLCNLYCTIRTTFLHVWYDIFMSNCG